MAGVSAESARSREPPEETAADRIDIVLNQNGKKASLAFALLAAGQRAGVRRETTTG